MVAALLELGAPRNLTCTIASKDLAVTPLGMAAYFGDGAAARALLEGMEGDAESAALASRAYELAGSEELRQALESHALQHGYELS